METEQYEGENPQIEWVPLAESLPDMDAEMTRGYLESHGIPAQLRPSHKGASVFRGIYLTSVPLDLYVPLDRVEEAVNALNNMPEMEPLIGDDEDFVLVYDEDGELQELDLSPGAPCPACGGVGIEHHVPEAGNTGLYILLWIFFLIGVTPAYRQLAEYFSEYAAILILGTGAGVLLVLSAPHMRSHAEKWYCSRCNKEWHK